MNAVYAKANIPVGFESRPLVLADAMKKLASLPLEHNPGEKWTYGLNTDMLGYLVEIWSGKSLDSYMKERLFEPLGMTDTYFYLPAEKQWRLTDVHGFDSAHKLVVVKNPFTTYPVDGSTYFSGGAGLSSTMADYAAFLQMILNRGEYNGNQILKPETVDLILQNHIGDLNVGNDKFGLGFQITTAKGKEDSGMSVGSFSWGGYYATTYWGDPEKKIVALLFMQMFPLEHGELHSNFRKIVYSAMED
jgi:CubicO group peptidase (beta-lactamase class C family)